MFLAGPVDIASADVKFAVLFSAASSSVKLKKNDFPTSYRYIIISI